MYKTIENVLKTRIGTSFIHEDTKGMKVFKLINYGEGVWIVYDDVAKDKLFTRITDLDSKSMFIIMIEQNDVCYDDKLTLGIKMMIDYIKKYKQGKHHEAH